MTKFYIEDDDFIVYHVDEKMFRKVLSQAKNEKMWGDLSEIEIEKDKVNGTIKKMWYFQWTRMWIIADDYKELEELGL